jgi:hypothetical protein
MIPAAAPMTMTANDLSPIDRRSEMAADLEVAAALAAVPEAEPEALPDLLPVADAPEEEVAEPEAAVEEDDPELDPASV